MFFRGVVCFFVFWCCSERWAESFLACQDRGPITIAKHLTIIRRKSVDYPLVTSDFLVRFCCLSHDVLFEVYDSFRLSQDWPSPLMAWGLDYLKCSICGNKLCLVGQVSFLSVIYKDNYAEEVCCEREIMCACRFLLL